MKTSYIILMIFVFLLGTKVFSQEKFTKAQIKQLKEADSYFESADYVNALAIYENLYPYDSLSGELNYKIGISKYYLVKNKVVSSPYFEKAVSKDHIEALFYLGTVYHLQEKLDDAIKMFQKYKNQGSRKEISDKEVNRQIDMALRAQEMMENPKSVSIENKGGIVNSAYHDYVPLINADESVLIFTSRREGSTGGKKDPYNRYFEDVYISYKEDGQWTSPENMGSPVNTATHDACVGLSPDGNILILYRTNQALTGGDLYWTKLEGTTWSEPEKFDENINSKNYQEASATMTQDEIVMYFSSNRPGGYGGKDIYRVVRFMNGEWSLPMNLGPTINTSYDDDAPFIHPDGKTLYFSSKGHRTMGGYDIFKSVLDEDGLWSVPENIGYPINTVDDDIYFVLSADGKRGYYSSNKEEGFGGQDIYTILMPDATKKLAIIKGKVASVEGGRPISAKITIIDNRTHEIQGIYQANSASGKYILVMAPENSYKMLVEAEGYHSLTEELFFTNKESFIEIEKEIRMESSKSEENENKKSEIVPE